jgi:hypothetical protein
MSGSPDRRSRARCLLAVCFALVATIAVADDPARTGPALEVAETAKAMSLTVDGRAAKGVEILKWGNQVREEQAGVVRCWLDDGRVVAVSTVFSSRIESSKIRITQEWTALSTAAMLAYRSEEVRWRTEKTGPAFQPVAAAPVPEGTRAARLRQLRELSKRFTGVSESPYKANERWELRLLPRPLYRYGEGTADQGDAQASSSVLDGALFSLVSNAGTDPEILLLIEARRSGEGWRYEYVASRFSDHSLTLSYDGQSVWEFRNPEPNAFYQAGLTDRYRLFVDREYDASSGTERK